MIRILITSKKHQYYDKTGVVIKDEGDGGLFIKIDKTNEVVLVANGQFKPTSIQP